MKLQPLPLSLLLAAAPLVCLLASAPVAMAQMKVANSSAATAAASSSRVDAKPIEDLKAAAQRLRDSIQDMAKTPAGPQRADAIRAGNKALAEVNVAMANLPPQMLTGAADEGAYRKALDRLQQSSQRLRDATHALAADPASKRRNETIRDIDKALGEVQQVMIDVPANAWAKM